jgi:hypothetical protein
VAALAGVGAIAFVPSGASPGQPLVHPIAQTAPSSSPTSSLPQIASMQASFLADAPAPPHSSALCLVDTGVTPNPGDSQALLTETAIDGGSADDNVGHGTVLADALANGSGSWGVPGMWPQIKLISVRVTDSSGDIGIGNVASGITACQVLGATVINVSLGGTSLGTYGTQLQGAIENAHSAGILVVAGSGDDSGAVEYPAALPGVLAVGGVDASGAYCSDSSQGAQVRLVAPGCNLFVNDEGGGPAVGVGTSFASAYVAGTVAALQAYGALTSEQAESDILASAASSPSGPELDVSGAFGAAGLGALVDLEGGEVPTTAGAGTAPVPVKAAVVPTPKGVSASWAHHEVVVRARRLPTHLSMLIQARGASFSSTRPVASLPVARVGSIKVAYASATGARSRWVSVRVR